MCAPRTFRMWVERARGTAVSLRTLSIGSNRVREGGVGFDDGNEFFAHRLPELAGKHFAIISSDRIRAKDQGRLR